jgi:hypothetical protein
MVGGRTDVERVGGSCGIGCRGRAIIGGPMTAKEAWGRTFGYVPMNDWSTLRCVGVGAYSLLGISHCKNNTTNSFCSTNDPGSYKVNLSLLLCLTLLSVPMAVCCPNLRNLYWLLVQPAACVPLCHLVCGEGREHPCLWDSIGSRPW